MAASNVLVIGGCGFIGSHFVDYLLEHTDHNVINIDAITYAANKEYTQISNPRYQFINGNLADHNLMKEVFIRYTPEYTVNFAAESHVTRSINDPQKFIETNILGAYVLLETFMKYGSGRLHQVSSDEVYGSLSLGEDSFTEMSRYNPSTPYAASKAAADHLMFAWQKTYNLNITVSSSSNNYGIRQNDEKLIPLVIDKIIKDTPVTVHGSGDQIRDWISAKDHCSAIYTILVSGTPGNKYNIGASNELKNIDIIYKIFSLMGKEPNIEFVEDRAANDFRYSTNADKLAMLGWKPKIKFDDGILEVIQWKLLQTHGNIS
jgi:dTDP-glucose 4,6-dehydratase